MSARKDLFMNKMAMIEVEKFAKWFVPLLGLDFLSSGGIDASFSFGENVGELKFCSLYREDNKISLDMESWRTIFSNYLLFRGVSGWLVSLLEYEKGYCGMRILAEIGNNSSNRDGIYFLEEK